MSKGKLRTGSFINLYKSGKPLLVEWFNGEPKDLELYLTINGVITPLFPCPEPTAVSLGMPSVKAVEVKTARASPVIPIATPSVIGRPIERRHVLLAHELLAHASSLGGGVSAGGVSAGGVLAGGVSAGGVGEREVFETKDLTPEFISSLKQEDIIVAKNNILNEEYLYLEPGSNVIKKGTLKSMRDIDSRDYLINNSPSYIPPRMYTITSEDGTSITVDKIYQVAYRTAHVGGKR